MDCFNICAEGLGEISALDSTALFLQGCFQQWCVNRKVAVPVPGQAQRGDKGCPTGNFLVRLRFVMSCLELCPTQSYFGVIISFGSPGFAFKKGEKS